MSHMMTAAELESLAATLKTCTETMRRDGQLIGSYRLFFRDVAGVAVEAAARGEWKTAEALRVAIESWSARAGEFVVREEN